MSRGNRKQDTYHGQAPKAWFWLLVGLLIGALIVLLLPSRDWLPWIRKDSAQNEAEAAAIQSAAERREPGTDQTAIPHFEFYTLLPEMEAAVPKPGQSSPSQPESVPELKTDAAPSSRPESAPSEAPSDVYVLQVGSFRNYAQADSRKAALALLGIDADIQTVTIDSSKTWHRVRIGPSTDLPKLRRISEQLHEKQIESQLYKVRS